MKGKGKKTGRQTGSNLGERLEPRPTVYPPRNGLLLKRTKLILLIMKYTESKLTTAAATHKKEVATQTKIQNAEVDNNNKNVYCVIEQNILSKTSKILKAFNTEAKAKAFASSTNTTADYNLVIEEIKLE